MKTTIKIDNLEVMSEDLGRMEWYDAKEACEKLGDGWRLPTKDELNILYENKDKIGGFVDFAYSSCTEEFPEDYDGGDTYLVKDFENGFETYESKEGDDFFVRAVRVL